MLSMSFKDVENGSVANLQVNKLSLSKLIFLIAGTLRSSKRVAIEIQQQQHHCLPCESLIIKIYPQRINARHKDIHSKIKLGQSCKMSKTEKIVIVLKGVQPCKRGSIFKHVRHGGINIFCCQPFLSIFVKIALKVGKQR